MGMGVIWDATKKQHLPVSKRTKRTRSKIQQARSHPGSYFQSAVKVSGQDTAFGYLSPSDLSTHSSGMGGGPHLPAPALRREPI